MSSATVGALSFLKVNDDLLCNVEIQREFWVEAIKKENPTLDAEDIRNEVDLEILMTTEGMIRQERKTQQAQQNGTESVTDYGRYIMRHKIKEVADEIAATLENVKAGKPGYCMTNLRLIKDLEPRVIAYIATKMLIDCISAKPSLQTVAIAVGAELETEARLNLFKTVAPNDFEFAMKRATRRPEKHSKRASLVTMMNKKARGEYDEGAEQDELLWEAWTTRDKLGVGLKLLTVVMNCTGIAEAKIVKLHRASKGSYHMYPTEEFRAWIQDMKERTALLSPVTLPTVIPPRDYSGYDDGGYHTRLLPKTRLLKTNNRAYIGCLRGYDLSTVTEAINTAQRTPWRINRRILETVRHMWENGLDFGVLPRQGEEPLPCCPQCGLPIHRLNEAKDNTHRCFSDPVVLQRWKRDAVIVHERNHKAFSKRLQAHRILWAAETMEKYPRIYFPYQLDFRGRLYAVPQFLNPQGCDLSKGLLEFSDALPIMDEDARKWLAIHTANTWGEDKASFTDRVKWTEDHTEMIQRIADDPIENREWKDADSPLCFLAACFEWAGFIREGYGYLSRIPVAQDGTCSGLQHYSAILRDQTGGEAVNLVPAERPQDIYAVVALRTLSKLNAATTSDENFHTAQQWINSGLVTRKLTKRSVMTLPYGSTLFSCKQYVREHVEEMREKDSVEIPWPYDETQKACNYIGNVIWEAIKETVIAASTAMEWLHKLAKVCTDAGYPLTWTTPTGLPVLQTYVETQARFVNTSISGCMYINTGKESKTITANTSKRLIKLSLHEETDNIDKAKQITGLAPNFIHSLDASALVFAVLKASAEGIDTFALIHDSFGTHAARSAHLARALREAFVAMYEEHDVLREIRDEVAAMLPEEARTLLPAPPIRGTLDLKSVLSSPYFFA